MTESHARPAVLAIDDDPELLAELVAALRTESPDLEVISWSPSPDNREKDILDEFGEALTERVGLVATDHDLTRHGPRGLLGTTVATWCQELHLPVCGFSRKPETELPLERSFFEIRIPRGSELERARSVIRLARGFEDVRAFVSEDAGELSLSEQLAHVMQLPDLTDDLSPYLTSISLANSQVLMQVNREEADASSEQKIKALRSYVLGHIIVNAILEYPGPLMRLSHLCAYIGVGESSAHKLSEAFSSSRYSGPFSLYQEFFVREQIDESISAILDELGPPAQDADEHRFRRAVVEATLGSLANHGCDRCGGEQGGFWCPFTRRAVCAEERCSLGTTSWIPRGASLCRVEATFYHEHEPLLGS